MTTIPGSTLLGLPVWVEGKAALTHRLGRQPGLHVLHSVNAEIAIQAQSNGRLREALQRNATNLIDGEGVNTMLRLKYRRRFERISGSSVIYDLARLAGTMRWPMLLLGGTPSAGVAARQRLAELSGTEVLWHDPPVIQGEDFDDAARQAIREVVVAHHIAVIVVCLGAPKQEIWIESERAWLQQQGVRVCLSAGGTLEFVAGTVPRAPDWVSRLGAEWLFRLLLEPRRRWRRMASRLPRFLVRSLAEVVRHRLGGMLSLRNRSTERTPPGENGDELIVLRMERHAVDEGRLYSETSFVHWLEEAQRLGPRLTLVARGVPRPRLKTSGETAPSITLGPGCRFLSAGPAQGMLGALLGSFRIALALLRARWRGADVLVRVPEHSSFVTAPLLFLLGFKVHVWVVADRIGMLQSMLAFSSPPRRLALRLAHGINGLAERFLLRRARTLFTNGAEIMSQFGRAGRGRDPVVLVSSTISQAHVAWTRARREALSKQRTTRAAEPTTVVRGLCVARLTPEKGHDFLLECMRATAGSGTRLQVRLVGFEDPGHGDRLRAIATDLDVADQVEFVGALPFGNRLFEEYASADCVVLTSRREGTPRVLAEAYMLGLPIIATRVGGIASGYAGQEQEGVYLIEFGDHAAFAAALGQVVAWISAGRPAFPRTRDRSVGACVRTMIEHIQTEQRTSRRSRSPAGVGDSR